MPASSLASTVRSPPAPTSPGPAPVNSMNASAPLATLLLARMNPAAVDLTPNRPTFCEVEVLETVELISGADSAETVRSPAAVSAESRP